jgi:hypothetical protein
MKFTKRNDITINGVRLGLTLRDSVLRRETDYTPILQTFTLEDLEEEDPEERTYWCAVCKGQLTYLDKTSSNGRIFISTCIIINTYCHQG